MYDIPFLPPFNSLARERERVCVFLPRLHSFSLVPLLPRNSFFFHFFTPPPRKLNYSLLQVISRTIPTSSQRIPPKTPRPYHHHNHHHLLPSCHIATYLEPEPECTKMSKSCVKCFCQEGREGFGFFLKGEK